MALIFQKGKPPPGPFYMRHPIHGTKLVQPEDREREEELGYVKLVKPLWLYHKDHPAEIFDTSQKKNLAEKGWVTSPAFVHKPLPSEDLPVIRAAMEKLLDDGELCQAATMRELGININQRQRDKFQPTYKQLFKEYEDRIVRKGMKFLWKPEPTKLQDIPDYVTEAAQEAVNA